MKHPIGHLVLIVMNAAAIGLAAPPTRADMNALAKSYCESASRVARLKNPVSEFRNWTLASYVFEEWRNPEADGYRQFRCGVEAECRVVRYISNTCQSFGCPTTETWIGSSHYGITPPTVQKLRCQDDGYLLPQ